MNENLIAIDQWKEKKNYFELVSQTKEYYQLLSFDQLISESKDLRNKISRGSAVENLGIKTKFIFDEIQNRMINSEQKDAVQTFQETVS